MNKNDEAREELIRQIISLCDYARLGARISTYDNCNNCADRGCQYRPRPGQSVRWNCPLWKGE